MKTIKVEWRPETAATIALRVADVDKVRERERASDEGRPTKLIVITASGAVLHQRG